MKRILACIASIGVIATLLTGCGSTYTQDATRSIREDTSYMSGGDGRSNNSGMSIDSEVLNGFAASGSSSKSSQSYENTSEVSDYEYESSFTEESTQDSSATHDAEMTLAEEKLVYKCSMSIETMDYNDSMAKINEIIDKYNGIVQSTYEYDNANDWYYENYAKRTGTLRCTMSIRVPSSNYKEMTESLGDIGRVKSKSSNVENISQQYYDTTIRIEALEKEESRLMDMMNSAYTIEDMITIEERLSTVESELMILKTDIKYMDMDVAYSYVDLELKEVMEYSEDATPVKTNKFVDRLMNQLSDTWKGLLRNLENLLFAVIALMPYIIIIVVIVVVYRKLLRKKVKAIRDKRAEKRKESGDLSLRDMSKMVNDLNKQLESKDKSDKQ